MILIKGYKEVKYKELRDLLLNKYNKSGKSFVDLASLVGVKSLSSIQNCFSYPKQVASDTLLSKAMLHLDFKGLIVSVDGEKKYYIKSNH